MSAQTSEKVPIPESSDGHRRRVMGDPRRFLVGMDGPEVRTPPSVARYIAPMARTWLEAIRRGAGTEQAALLEEWCSNIEALAEWQRRFRAADGAFDGHLGHLDPAQGEPDVVRRSGVTTGEAGRWLGIHPRHVIRLLGRGGLTGSKLGRQWLVDADSVTAYLELRRQEAA